jgi:hypothetical protein
MSENLLHVLFQFRFAETNSSALEVSIPAGSTRLVHTYFTPNRVAWESAKLNIKPVTSAKGPGLKATLALMGFGGRPKIVVKYGGVADKKFFLGTTPIGYVHKLSVENESDAPGFVMLRLVENEDESSWIVVPSDFVLAPRQTREIEMTVGEPRNGPGNFQGRLVVHAGPELCRQVFTLERLSNLFCDTFVRVRFHYEMLNVRRPNNIKINM